MSVWQTTAFIPSVQREIVMTVLMPDLSPDEKERFETSLIIAPKGYESDYIVRHTTLEVLLCKKGRHAAVCLPGYIDDIAKDCKVMEEHIIPFLCNLYPLHINQLCLIDGSAHELCLPVVSFGDLLAL